jgi:hypothetical protein
MAVCNSFATMKVPGLASVSKLIDRKRPPSTTNSFLFSLGKYLFEIDMSRSWDTKTTFSEKRLGRFGNAAMASNPPNMVRGALFRGPNNDKRLFTFGGTTFLANETDPQWQPPASDQYSLWSFDTSSLVWAQFDVTDAVPRRPNWGAWTEAIGAGLGFMLNGQIDHGSSNVRHSLTEYIGGVISNRTRIQTTYIDGMVIVDLLKRKARKVSTDTLGVPRVAGGLIHTTSFGKSKFGALITFGGMRSTDPTNNTFYNGALVSSFSHLIQKALQVLQLHTDMRNLAGLQCSLIIRLVPRCNSHMGQPDNHGRCTSTTNRLLRPSLHEASSRQLELQFVHTNKTHLLPCPQIEPRGLTGMQLRLRRLRSHKIHHI